MHGLLRDLRILFEVLIFAVVVTALVLVGTLVSGIARLLQRVIAVSAQILPLTLATRLVRRLGFRCS